MKRDVVAIMKEGHDGHTCPECAPNEQPVTPIVLMAVGGMLLFFSFFFLLIAMIGVRGFLIPALVVMAFASLMVIIGYRLNREHRIRKHEIMHMKIQNARCKYCGTQNKPDSRRCDSCGAPLKE